MNLTKDSALKAEQDDNARLRKSSEAVEYYRQKEGEALRELASVREQLKRARDKHFGLFDECEKRACARRAAGLIEVSSEY
jgi:hypothetical protein